jgi:pre-mRNA-splicing factor ISY1
MANLSMYLTRPRPEWEDAHAHLREVLGLLSDQLSISPIPCGTSAPLSSIPPQYTLPPAASDGKRKARNEDGAPAPESDGELVKRSKPDAPVPTSNAPQADAAATAFVHARAAAAYIPFLSVETLLPPKMPTKGEMEGVLRVA